MHAAANHKRRHLVASLSWSPSVPLYTEERRGRLTTSTTAQYSIFQTSPHTPLLYAKLSMTLAIPFLAKGETSPKSPFYHGIIRRFAWKNQTICFTVPYFCWCSSLQRFWFPLYNCLCSHCFQNFGLSYPNNFKTNPNLPDCKLFVAPISCNCFLRRKWNCH